MNWNHTAIEQAIREEVARALDVPLESVTAPSRLVADLGAESIDLIDLAFRLESRFNLSLPEGIAVDRARSGSRDPSLSDLADEIEQRLR